MDVMKRFTFLHAKRNILLEHFLLVTDGTFEMDDIAMA
jgi:hypothetical protein